MIILIMKAQTFRILKCRFIYTVYANTEQKIIKSQPAASYAAKQQSYFATSHLKGCSTRQLFHSAYTIHKFLPSIISKSLSVGKSSNRALELLKSDLWYPLGIETSVRAILLKSSLGRRKLSTTGGIVGPL